MRQYCGSTIELVNVWDHCDNHRALAHVFPAPSRARWSRTGNAAARAFAFQGRCFVVVGRVALGERSARIAARLQRSSRSEAEGRPLLRVAAGGHHKASSAVRAQRHQLMGLYGPHPMNTADPVRLPVLTPHAQVPQGNRIYRGPERGMNPPDLFRVLCGSSSSTLGRPIVVFRSASKPQVGGLTSDRPSAGQCPLVKVPGAFPLRSVGVGRFHGVGVTRPEY
jgi:hypothetical protein